MSSLIINARDRLRWYQRLWSDASTVLMWWAWLKLWDPVLRSLVRAADFGVLSQLASMKLLTGGPGPVVDVRQYALALVGTSGTLLLWKGLPAIKARAPEAHTLRDYARHFELPEDELVASRGTAVCVVHHDECGRITRVERRLASAAAVGDSPRAAA